MPDYIIRRLFETEHGTFGQLEDPHGEVLFKTLERCWVDADKDGHRDRNVSRFVPGTYKCVYRKSHLHGGTSKRDCDVWEFVGVPDVDNAQIHVANVLDQLEGCVALGLDFGDVQRPTDPKPLPGVIGSKAAVGQFMHMTRDRAEIEVEVIDSFHL